MKYHMIVEAAGAMLDRTHDKWWAGTARVLSSQAGEIRLEEACTACTLAPSN